MTQKNTYPEVRIKNAFLLREGASEGLNELWGDGTPLHDHDYYQKIVDAYNKAWQPKEALIMNAMQDILGLKFKHNIIDVYIAPWFAAFSDPMVIGVQHDPDSFIDTLTHEILHRLLTDNTKLDLSEEDRTLTTEWAKLFGKDHSWNTLIHIPVHAVLKDIYLNVLKEERRLKRDIDEHQKYEDYKKAWAYVEGNDYKEITSQLKKSYARMAKESRHA